MEDKILKIKIGEEYKAKVETVGEFKDSMFKDVYDKAFDCVNSILVENLKNKNDKEKTNKESYEKYNNIISFVGERGTGKTSAMLSVSRALKDEYPTEFKKKIFKGLKSDDKPKHIFNEIGVIDPSHFDRNSNILEIILAKMFKKFKKRVEDKNKDVDHDNKRKLIKAFEEVFENLKTIQNPKGLYNGEALDALLKMSASTDLKGNMTNLVEEYLSFFNDSNNAILLLEIDDIDLSTKYAYEMIEQIRKYLIIPKVVILMAVKMQQLSHILERNTRKEFEDLLKKSHMKDEEPKNMAEKYLEKLIPLDRRLFLPTLEGINLNIDLIIQDKEGNEYIIGKDSNKEIKNVVRYLIFKRTGNMFFNTDTQVSYIIPRTLRELINLVSKLIAMENNDKKEEIKVEIEDKEKTIRVITLDDLKSKQKDKNYESFKEYFLSYWVESTLKSNHVEVIREVIKRDIKERNKYIVRALNQEYPEKFDEIKNIHKKRTEVTLESEYSEIVDFANKPMNISLGDLLLVLDLTNRLIVDAEDKKFIFAIKTTYSIMLYGLIREIKAFTKSISKDLKKIEEESTKEIVKKLSKEMSLRKNKIEEYRSLLGQSLYNSIQYNNLKEFSWEYNNKDSAIIDHTIDYEKISEEGKNDKNEFNRLTKILTTVSGEKQDERRNYSIDFADSQSTKKIYKFDILGFFYNFLDRESLKCYLGNIELFEKLLTSSKKISDHKSYSFLENLKKFIKGYEKIIKDEFLDEKFDILQDSIIEEIPYFYEKYSANENYNKYFENLKKEKEKEKEKLRAAIEEIEKITGRNRKKSTFLEDINEILKTLKRKIIEEILSNIKDILELPEKEGDIMNKEEIEVTKIHIVNFINDNFINPSEDEE